MKTFVRITVVLATILACFWIGRVYQHWKAGFVYVLHDEHFESAKFGKLCLRHDSERFGKHSIDRNFTTISLDTFYGKVIIYRDESKDVGAVNHEPRWMVESVSINDDVIQWDDGSFEYKLRMMIASKVEKPTLPPLPVHPSILSGKLNSR